MQNIFFLDIETVPETQNLSAEKTELFYKKFIAEFEKVGVSPRWYSLFITSVYYKKAALCAEFGRIVCISIGRLFDGRFHVKTIIHRQEKEILKMATEALAKAQAVCGHNLKEFDAPFIVRRCIVNGLPVPPILTGYKVKPWESRLDDTMEIWGDGQWKYKVSLDLLANVLGIPSPKTEMTGADVGPTWYEPDDPDELPFDREARIFKKIGNYCNGDVLTTANVYARLKGLPPITADMLEFTEKLFKADGQMQIPLS